MRSILQDLIARLLERKPARRLGMQAGRAADVKRHRWFEGLDWEALGARKAMPYFLGIANVCIFNEHATWCYEA